MELLALSREDISSEYAAQLQKGYSRLRFSRPLESEFRAFYVAQNLPRGRLSGFIGLVLVLAITLVDMFFGESAEGNLTNIIRLGVLCPLLIAVVIATYSRALEKLYAEVAAVGVTLTGLVVIFLCVMAASTGASYALSGVILVTLFACLFLGLFFYQAAAISAVLVVAHIAMAYFMGLSFDELLFSTATLVSASVIGNIATYNLEYALRTNFLENCLLNALAERDGLTGLYNRRIFDDYMRRVWRQARRDQVSVEVILIDIDDFKSFNDLYGHQHGDDCLKIVAKTIAKHAKRPLDFSARYGGEEFVLVLFGPPGEFGRLMPEQIRHEIEDLAIPHEGSSVARFVTVSIGVARAQPGVGRSLAGAIQVADEALYEAKRGGRNQVVYKNANELDMETGKFRVRSEKFA